MHFFTIYTTIQHNFLAHVESQLQSAARNRVFGKNLVSVVRSYLPRSLRQIVTTAGIVPTIRNPITLQMGQRTG